MTEHFPIALTAVALFFLALALRWRNEVLEQAAFFNISLAAVSTVVAGLTGLQDNLVRFDGAAPNANARVFLGISLLNLTTVTALSRWRRMESRSCRRCQLGPPKELGIDGDRYGAQ